LLSERYQFPLNRIHLEVTEGAFLTNTDLAIDMMKPLQEKGVKFVLDDFGTGYSSLAYLQKLPIEYLKIDKSFVRFMTTNGDDLAIVENILSLAKSLGLRTVAEGVETKEQFDLLLAKGCDYFQGWYFGRPSEHLGLPSNFSTPLYS
jgi:EAL domain-containing protein (putative c-di-GMP-specific phosphodiesterase class I)